jgi:hypothetical protein
LNCGRTGAIDGIGLGGAENCELWEGIEYTVEELEVVFVAVVFDLFSPLYPFEEDATEGVKDLGTENAR